MTLVRVRVAARTGRCGICRFRIQRGQHIIRWRGACAHTICVVQARMAALAGAAPGDRGSDRGSDGAGH